MSTRSLVGGLTDSGTFVVYVHWDGYPEARLPILEALIKRDGAAKVLATILMANEGGWSHLDQNTGVTPTANQLGGRGRIVEGYGLRYTDAPEVKPIRFPEEWDGTSWAEFVYLIPEVGPIVWANASDKAPEDWDWQHHEVKA